MSSIKKQQTLHSFDALASATGRQVSDSKSGMQTKKKIITLKKSNQDMATYNSNSDSRPNIGWMFYKDYFKKVKYGNITNDKVIEANDAKLIKEKNKKIIDSKWVQVKDGLGDPSQSFLLKVTYPGLVTGIGLSHEAGVEGELKMGLHFDYTFGQPVIHGSSVKGLLRSVFPKGERDKHAEAKFNFLQKELNKLLKKEFSSEEIKLLELEIFEGKRRDGTLIDIYHRDIFFDAIMDEGNQNNRILESDSITPHGSNPLKNPIPLPFLKISSGCIIQFRFDLHPGILEIKEKITLFTEIFKTLGIGAKTNVGYGQFDDSSVEN